MNMQGCRGIFFPTSLQSYIFSDTMNTERTGSPMKFILKILLAPIMLIFWIVELICKLALKLSSVVFVAIAILFALASIPALFGWQYIEWLHLPCDCISALTLRFAKIGHPSCGMVNSYADTAQGKNLRISETIKNMNRRRDNPASFLSEELWRQHELSPCT